MASSVALVEVDREGGGGGGGGDDDGDDDDDDDDGNGGAATATAARRRRPRAAVTCGAPEGVRGERESGGAAGDGGEKGRGARVRVGIVRARPSRVQRVLQRRAKRTFERRRSGGSAERCSALGGGSAARPPMERLARRGLWS